MNSHLATLILTLTYRVLILAHPVDSNNDIMIKGPTLRYWNELDQIMSQVGWQACKCMQSQQILTHFCPHTERSHWDTQCQKVS